ncbi:TraB/GumN family protein [Mesobacterium pallidum]|uniref:TraB/GumN family protein n=1 Tax=Mesobacterium pallidum TaxID=2872037 RepID=UPI001EE1AC94|nr:TraB/GumN family protein [Mesobacterium pallidum]
MRRLLILAAFLLPSVAGATCNGRDLRPSLPEAVTESIAAEVAAMPFPAGNHWTARRGDAVVTLVGTVHVGDPRLDGVMARLAPLVAGADRVLLEMTPAEQMELQAALARDPSLISLTADTLPDLLPEDQWQRLSQAASARGVPGFMAAKFRPWYLATLLAVPPCAAAQLTAGPNGLDHRIIALAEAENIPMQALEPYDTLFSLFADMPMDEQLEMLESALPDAARAEDEFATLMALYFEEAHGAVWALSRWQAGQNNPDLTEADLDDQMAETRDLLLTRRNAAWLPRILAASEGGPVGAAHLGGADGLLALLEAEGFSLERQGF